METKTVGVPASGDLSAKQFYLMAINSSGQLATATVRGQRTHGVLQDDPAASGRNGVLAYGGITQVECGGSFNPGAELTTDSSGKAILANQLDDVVIGTALEAGVSGARASMIVGVAGGYISDPTKVISEDFNAWDTTDQVASIQPDGTVADGTGDVLNHMYTGNNVFCYEALGTQTILSPVVVAAGLDIGMDQTDNDGVELFSHFLGASGRPFIIGQDPAFYFECKWQITDGNGTDDLQMGFRRAEICRPNWDDYTDAAALGIITVANPAALYIQTILNNAATTETDTTDTLADATAVTFKVLVSAAGVVTYTIDGAAPTATAAFTFDNGDPVIPFFRHLQANVAQNGNLILHTWNVGYQ
jgi:hypothetical protein